VARDGPVYFLNIPFIATIKITMAKNSKIKYIVFDLDQTLINHHQGELAGLEKIFRLFFIKQEQGFAKFVDDFVKVNLKLWDGLKDGTYDANFIINNRFKYLTPQYGLESKAEKIQGIYGAHYINCCAPFCGTKLLLEALSKLKIPMAIGSNGLVDYQLKKLHTHKLKKYFTKFYFGNKAPFCKPHSHFFRHIIDDLKLQPHEILFVGDSLAADITPALEAGMKVLHIDHNYLNGDNLAHEKILSFVRTRLTNNLLDTGFQKHR
jgi:putative hydrolase of the HAD superfamily